MTITAAIRNLPEPPRERAPAVAAGSLGGCC